MIQCCHHVYFGKIFIQFAWKSHTFQPRRKNSLFRYRNSFHCILEFVNFVDNFENTAKTSLPTNSSEDEVVEEPVIKKFNDYFTN